MPKLQAYLDWNFHGLKVVTMTCDDDTLQKMKEEQKSTEKKEGPGLVYVQGSDSGSISSSDEEKLDHHARKSNGAAVKEARRAKKAATDPKQAVMEWASQQA